jgi:ubiquinone/menaquinone biosynthesis C-methylase UbiE
MPEQYTLGYDAIALAFVSRRRLDPDGAALIPLLRPGMAVLDCGCGPGTVTVEIALRVAEGSVVGLDLDESQVRLGHALAQRRGCRNVSFRQGDVYRLPFEEASFDAVFSHALFEHLSDPLRALRELLRVLEPGAPAVVCTPDWGSFLYSPATAPLIAAVRAYCELQNRNGGDVRIGHKLLDYARQAGFERVRASARYENYQPLSVIGDLVAGKLDQSGLVQEAAAMRDWAAHSDGMFAQAWVSCVAWRPAS